MSEQTSSRGRYDVVVDESQKLTLWPTDRKMPAGWREATTKEAKIYINEIPPNSRYLLQALSETTQR